MWAIVCFVFCRMACVSCMIFVFLFGMWDFVFCVLLYSMRIFFVCVPLYDMWTFLCCVGFCILCGLFYGMWDFVWFAGCCIFTLIHVMWSDERHVVFCVSYVHICTVCSLV